MASTSEQADGLLTAAVRDAVQLSSRRGGPRFVGFLDQRQGRLARAAVPRERAVDALLYGGHPDAERRLLGVFPPGQPPDEAAFPVTALTLHVRAADALSHRDVLGSLLALGLKREAVGDILCGGDRVVVFVGSAVAPFVAQQLDRVGGAGVQVTVGYVAPLPAAHTFEPVRGTVASPRLDAVVRLAVGCAREEAARRIVSGLVSLDHVVCNAPARTVASGMVLSIRGTGRFAVEQIGPPTRKGRLNVVLQKYV